MKLKINCNDEIKDEHEEVKKRSEGVLIYWSMPRGTVWGNGEAGLQDAKRDLLALCLCFA